MLSILTALGSALLVAAGSVFQHRAGLGDAPVSLANSLRRPVWLVGAALGVSGFVLHVVALSAGALSVVQPLLVSGLVFALPLSRVLNRAPLHRNEVVAAVVVVGGLALFQATARPTQGNATASGALTWSVAAAAVVAVASFVFARFSDDRRALWLGLCAGVGFGLAAVLMKAALGVHDTHGVAALLRAWSLYAFVVVVVLAIAAGQLAFNAGPIASSLPLITIVDPVVAVIVGAVAFGETTATQTPLVIGQAVGFLTMTVGVVVLSRLEGAEESSAVTEPHGTGDSVEVGTPIGVEALNSR